MSRFKKKTEKRLESIEWDVKNFKRSFSGVFCGHEMDYFQNTNCLTDRIFRNKRDFKDFKKQTKYSFDRLEKKILAQAEIIKEMKELITKGREL